MHMVRYSTYNTSDWRVKLQSMCYNSDSFSFSLQCPMFDGLIGDKTIHILTHFIRRTEGALREYLRNYLLSRLDWFSHVSSDFFQHVQMSAEEYIDYISTPGSPIDILGLFLISRLYEIHIGVMFKSGFWTTCASEKLSDCMIVLIYNGINSFSETCWLNAEQDYMASIIDKTQQGVMPSHNKDLKITIEDEAHTSSSTETPTKDVKPKIKAENIFAKVENCFLLTYSKPANTKLNSQYSKAWNLIVKARKDVDKTDTKRKLAHLVSKAILSGNLNPQAIASKAHQSRQMRVMSCELCSKPCRSLREYLRHFKDDHPGGKFTCHHCEKQYTLWSGRYKHEKLHTDSAKLVVCLVCGRGFHCQNELPST